MWRSSGRADVFIATGLPRKGKSGSLVSRESTSVTHFSLQESVAQLNTQGNDLASGFSENGHLHQSWPRRESLQMMTITRMYPRSRYGYTVLVVGEIPINRTNVGKTLSSYSNQ